MTRRSTVTGDPTPTGTLGSIYQTTDPSTLLTSRSLLPLASASEPGLATIGASQTATPAALVSDTPSAEIVCAGGWDWQTAGTVSSAILGVLFGLTVWILWSILKRRKRLLWIYKPRSWFTPDE